MPLSPIPQPADWGRRSAPFRMPPKAAGASTKLEIATPRGCLRRSPARLEGYTPFEGFPANRDGLGRPRKKHPRHFHLGCNA